MSTPYFATSTAPATLHLALRGITAVVGGFEMSHDPKEYCKLPQARELPYPHLTLGEFDAFDISGQDIYTVPFAHSLLTYAYDPESVAQHLWDLMRKDDTVSRLVDSLVTISIDEIALSHTELKLILIPLQKHTWERIAHALVHSMAFKRILNSFAKSYLENLIIPFMTPQVPPPFSPETSGKIQSTLKELLIARDGHRTVVGGIWNYDRPDEVITNDIERQEEIQEDYFVPGTIIPYFFASSSRSNSLGGGGILWNDQYTANAKLRYYMQKFCGRDAADAVLMEDLEVIYHPNNGIVLTPELYTSFRRLRWCIEAEPWDTGSGSELSSSSSTCEICSGHGGSDGCQYVYRLWLLTRTPMPGLNVQQDGDPLNFGSCDVFSQIPNPRPLYCNVHAAISKVLRASGAGGAVEAILRNEQILKEEASTGANWGNLGREYLIRRLSAISEDE
ncbi:hypothetical protein H072_1974 [Dactylellina haptotyla CBS 200.50]|uniref:HNH nuclease domain-containing protein n=1 Tax=Dactylellina haptotyla (strain CBS 200.50) TaxID=1284197 RepID=S8AMC5_DACHA|nr:hypothetical protein H072_1974 [Dactylellina haptotyla CBS 200.50]